MENEIKTSLIDFLGTNSCCTFSLTLHHKGHNFELEFRDKKNEDCGDIYQKLEEWIGYGDLFNYLLDHGNLYNFEGFICVDESKEIKICVTFLGTHEDYEEEIYVSLDESIFINNLGFNLNEIGITDFDKDLVSLTFSIDNGIFVGDVSIKYGQEEKTINLNKLQQSTLKKHLLVYVMTNAPSLNVDFKCDQIIDAECDGNEIIYKVATSQINLNWNDIYSK